MQEMDDSMDEETREGISFTMHLIWVEQYYTENVATHLCVCAIAHLLFVAIELCV